MPAEFLLYYKSVNLECKTDANTKMGTAPLLCYCQAAIPTETSALLVQYISYAQRKGLQQRTFFSFHKEKLSWELLTTVLYIEWTAGLFVNKHNCLFLAYSNRPIQ